MLVEVLFMLIEERSNHQFHPATADTHMHDKQMKQRLW